MASEIKFVNEHAFCGAFVRALELTEAQLVEECLRACLNGQFGKRTTGEYLVKRGQGWKVKATGVVRNSFTITFNFQVELTNVDLLSPTLRAVVEAHRVPEPSSMWTKFKRFISLDESDE